MIKERLGTWKEHNKKLPTTILFYRDGVSESQFASVSEYKIPQIKEAYTDADGNANDLSVCFIVVGKRHHTRFYAQKKEDTYTFKAGGVPKGNLRPGLLVDHVVTTPKLVNFFL